MRRRAVLAEHALRAVMNLSEEDAAAHMYPNSLKQFESGAVHHSVLFCTYPAEAARAALARVTLARRSDARGPDEGLGIDGVMGDVQVDGQFQFRHAGEAVITPNALGGDVAEEASGRA